MYLSIYFRINFFFYVLLYTGVNVYGKSMLVMECSNNHQSIKAFNFENTFQSF